MAEHSPKGGNAKRRKRIMTNNAGYGEKGDERAGKRLLLSFVALAALVNGGYLACRGVCVSADTARYSMHADLLIAKGFDVGAYLRGSDFVVPPILYLGWVLVVALCKVVSGPSWPSGIVAINLLLSVATGFLVLSLVLRVTRSLGPPITAFALFIGCYDVYIWIPFVLSDISYMALSTAIVYCLLSIHGRKRRQMGIYLAAVFLSMLALIYRPSAIPVVMAAIAGYLMISVVDDSSALRRALFARKLFFALIVMFAFLSAAHAFVMQDPSLWLFSFARGWVETISREYHEGFVVYLRPETYSMPPATFMDYISITMKKLAYFFAMDASGFSFAHRVVNYAFFIPAYFLSLVAIASLLSANSSLSSDSWMVALISFMTILFYSLFHALQEIDFDWRYRLPCMPLLILLAAMGMAEINARWSQWRKPVPFMAG
jgi:hypothetical protein